MLLKNYRIRIHILILIFTMPLCGLRHDHPRHLQNQQVAAEHLPRLHHQTHHYHQQQYLQHHHDLLNYLLAQNLE